jgi:hypothetical protein
MISTMRTARPTTGSPLSLSEAGTAPFDPASSCLCLFGRLDPANPFIARQRRNVLPRLQRFCVGDQCLFQVRGQVMDHTARDLFFAQSFAHKFIVRSVTLREGRSSNPPKHPRAGQTRTSLGLKPDKLTHGRPGPLLTQSGHSQGQYTEAFAHPRSSRGVRSEGLPAHLGT